MARLCCLFVLLMLFVPPLYCRYRGDECFVEERSGTCTFLTDCEPLFMEIRRGGTPISSQLRSRLQALSCGFEDQQPVVCCVRPLTNVDPPGHHGLGFVTESPRPSTLSLNRPTPATNSNTERPWRTTTTQSPWSSGQTGSNDRNDRIPVRGSSSSSSNGPVDVTGHRNLRLLPKNCGIFDNDRIYGGNRTRLYEMPWMALISYQSQRGVKLSCAGTIINQWYVLTAAHCVSFLGSRMTLSGVLLGEHDVRRDPDCERVEGQLQCAPNVKNATIYSVIAHPGYTTQSLYDDIALIRLSDPADFSQDNIKPICLPITPKLQTESLAGLEGTVVGWGATEDGLQSPVLLSVDLPIVSNEECSNIYNGNPKIHDRQLCAGGVQDKDSCGGDSGGPLLYPGQVGTSGLKYVQRGIVSFGSKRCGIGGYPGVYTRIAYYMDWILDNIDE